eukprot:CAMPEP_0196719888 /NCGR_PEP_ID=MMETSP1091-20130531/2808_1 /TAXON_ID=302021 /ORGANISM="Rhodomonas sp., Strain CCMP768" /LENGTH=100 /DNA_ID=CAMNT_0042060973 /DNA_START=96 /DNA_END=398 /DNA_ORIENTATION=+
MQQSQKRLKNLQKLDLEVGTHVVSAAVAVAGHGTVRVPALPRVHSAANTKALVLIEVLDALRDLLGGQLGDVGSKTIAGSELAGEIAAGVESSLEALQHR